MRETGIIRKAYGGDTDSAQMYVSMARTQLGILKNLMSFQNLQQLSRTVTLANGVVVSVRSIFGQDAVDIYVPPGSEAVGGEEQKIVSAVDHAVDYVTMSMPNPVPYRGVSIGVVDKAPLSVVITIHDDGTQSGYPKEIGASMGGEVISTQTSYFHTDGITATYVNAYNPYNSTITNGSSPVGVPLPPGATVPVTSTAWWASAVATAATRDDLKSKTYVMASNGEVLASEVQNYSGENVKYAAMWTDGLADGAGPIFVLAPHPYGYNSMNSNAPVWAGGGGLYMWHYSTQAYQTLDHLLTFTVPEDCVSGSLMGYYPGPNSSVPSEWVSYKQTGIEAFNLRKKLWFKKNSDEFIAALKTGFAPGTEGVTRAELQLGRLPEAWEYQIKRDVDTKYNSYTPTNTVGRKTKREILYSEVSFSETTESDTSANLNQAGVKVTKRMVTLRYSITVNDVVETRELPLTGYLTQTVTRHNDANGDQLALSRQDVYDTWYNREATSLPSGVSSTITAPYLEDRTTSRIGVVLNGTVQNGYNTDSTLGIPGNPLTYALYVPPYPAAYSTITATVPEFITTWHKDAKITYLKDGVGASNALNDSAMYGVVEVHLTPIGAFTEESLGIFPDATTAQDATQVEMFGTAVYSFNWQIGAFAFKSWQPLHDSEGVEATSKIIDLPDATTWGSFGSNCLVTYKWVNDSKGVTTQWPDVVAALTRRNSTLQDSDPVLYGLIQAKKAG